MRSASRYGTVPINRGSGIGFRVGFQQVTEPPTDLNSTTALTITENQPVGAIVGEFNATDPEGGAITYSLVSGAGDGNNSLFTLDTNGTLKTAAILDYEAASSLSVRVQARDEYNASLEANFTVLVKDGVMVDLQYDALTFDGSLNDLQQGGATEVLVVGPAFGDFKIKQVHTIPSGMDVVFFGGQNLFLEANLSIESNQSIVFRAGGEVVIDAPISSTHTAGKVGIEYGQRYLSSDCEVFYRINQPVNLLPGYNFSTKCGKDGAKETYLVINSLGSSGSSTGLDLQGIKGNLTGKFALGSDVDANATKLWNSGNGFSPIGVPSSSWDTAGRFRGKFDGLGHRISNLHIYRPDSTSYSALFGYIDGAEIANIQLLDINVTGKSETGTVAGDSANSIISNIYATGQLTSSGMRVGGITGKSTGKLIHCSVDINASSTQPYFGGLVGHNYGEIRFSHSSGQVTSTYNDAGGLAGVNDGEIINSSSSASVQATHYTVGGLVGLNRGEINGCFFSGSVTGTVDYVAGIAAENSGSGKVKNSYSKGNITGQGAVGGLVGRVDGATIETSYSLASVSSNGGSYWEQYTGGLVGSERNSPTVLNSFWDTETSGKTTSFGGTGKTTAQLKDINTYLDAGWDFETVWFMPENSYPMLRWEDYNYPPQIIFDNPEKIDPNGKYHIGVEENKTFVMQISVSDTEEDDIIFSIHSGLDADFFQIDANTGVIEFKNPPDYEAFEDNRSLNKYDVRIKISDGTNEVLQSFDVWVSNIYEDTDGDGFRDSLEASAGSNLNDPASTPFNYGLVAWYPFDGNASDMSGNGNHGTVNGATLGIDRHGTEGKSYNFDGVNDWIEVLHNEQINFDSSSKFSLNLWVKILGPYSVMEKWHGSVSYPFVVRAGLDGVHKSLHFAKWDEVKSSIISIDSVGEIGDGFHSYAFICEPNKISAFMDGRFESSDTIETGEIHNNHNLFIGRWGGTEIRYFKGSIDDIRIYDRALSAEEISLLYRAESPNHFVNSPKDLEMLWVEPGTFTMGSPVTETGRQNDETEHNVTLTKGFYLGKYEVTQAQYEAVMTGNTETDSNGNVISATPSQYSGNPDRPVEKVSWDDIQVFLSRLNAQEVDNIPAGGAYVLPTEAQWEYACRAGTATAYSWGDDINSSYANYNWDNDWTTKQTFDVGQYVANPWGFFDMHGNVCEWTADEYQATYPTDNPAIDPVSLACDWFYYSRPWWSEMQIEHATLRSATRSARTSSERTYKVGFRLAFTQVTEPPKNLNSTAELSIAENQPIGTIIGEFNATDPEGHAITYSLVPFSPTHLSPALWGCIRWQCSPEF